MFDLDGYLDRIGLHGRPGLTDIHRAHAVAIPFENLDPRRGVPVSLEADALEPLPFGPGDPQEQLGWRYRVVEAEHELVLQAAGESGWVDLYGFVAEPVPLVDVETSNWFTATHPHSPFVTGLMVARHQPDGTQVTLSDWDELALTEVTPESRTVAPVSLESVPELLKSRFGLAGFGWDADGRIAPTIRER